MSNKQRHYLGSVPRLEAPEWVSQYDAAKELHVNMYHLGLIIANDHLDPAENAQREMGVSRQSLNAEKKWRSEVSWLRRMLRPLKDSLNWL